MLQPLPSLHPVCNIDARRKHLHHPLQVAVGAVDFVILGKDWLARGNRGKEVVYLLQFQGQAAGEEDWVQARKIKCEYCRDVSQKHSSWLATACHWDPQTMLLMDLACQNSVVMLTLSSVWRCFLHSMSQEGPPLRRRPYCGV